MFYTSSNLLCLVSLHIVSVLLAPECIFTASECHGLSDVHVIWHVLLEVQHLIRLCSDVLSITYSSWQNHQVVHIFYHFIQKAYCFCTFFFLLMWTYFEICSACVWQLVPISLFTGSKNTQVLNPAVYRNIREHAENFSTPSGVSDVLAMSCLQPESK